MDRIASFEIDHTKLKPGLYISRKDHVNFNRITTFDMRITTPYLEEVMDTGAIHTFEHLGATFLRNDKRWAQSVIYFGPMGCRTGFYIVMAGDLYPLDIYSLIKEMLEYIINFEGDIPGASEVECGNCYDMNLENAKKFAKKYYNEVINDFSKDKYIYNE